MSVSQCPETSDAKASPPAAGPVTDYPAGTAGAVWLSSGAAVLDPEARVLSANDALAAWLGATRGELAGQSLPTLLGQRFPAWEEPMRRFLRHTTAQFDRLELTSTPAEGSQKMGVEVCRHGEARFVRMESLLPPMHDFEEAFPEAYWGRAATHSVFNRLIRAEAQLDNLVHRWPGIIFSQRPDFSFAFVSPRIEDLTGVSAQEWRRQTKYFWQVVHEADVEGLRKRLRQANNSPEGITSTYRVRHIQTGRVSYLWEHRQAVRSHNGLLLGYEGICLDITRQTIAERRLLTMSWKENLGTLTMGLAHDFCNIMAGIVALSDTFETELGEKESLRNGLTLIRSTAGQASELAHRIRQLHQGVPGEKSYLDLNEVVGGMAGVLQKVVTRRVRVETEFAPGQLPVYADAVELRQVIVNLALNAVDAMAEGGTLMLRTSRHEQPPTERPLQGGFPPAPLVCLSVQDTGAGIPANYLNSIFDPFFTTKPLGKGSGLGLYNTRLFTESHGLAVSVESREQVGTAFHLWFPEADFSEAEQSPGERTTQTRHTLLVAGPPGEARDRMVEMLRTHGFYVVAANPKTEALAALHSTDYHFSGVILLCQRVHADELILFQRLQTEKSPVRIFLAFPGCNQDEIDTTLLERADAMLPPDLPAREWVARIQSALAHA